METLGRYQIGEEVGRGGGGIVYAATDPTTGDKVAIKMIPVSGSFGTADREMLVQRLKREAESAGSLDHPNIVKVHEFDDENNVYFVMEFVEGRTLEQILKSGDRPSRDRIIGILEQTAEALDFAHNRGIVHRDVKPANIMVTDGNVVKVTDFGVAKMLNATHATQLTVAGTMLGSPHYMSPEQVTETGVDGRSDQFSLGVVAYELVVGRKPFEGDFAPSVLYQIVSETPPPVEEVDPSLPASVNRVLRRALGKKRLERYPSCLDFIKELKSELGAASAGAEHATEELHHADPAVPGNGLEQLDTGRSEPVATEQPASAKSKHETTGAIAASEKVNGRPVEEKSGVAPRPSLWRRLFSKR